MFQEALPRISRSCLFWLYCLYKIIKSKLFRLKFNMDDTDNTMFSPNSNTPKLVQVVIKYSGGLIKNEKHATYVLFGFVLIVTLVSFFLVFGGKGDVNFNPED